MDYAKEKEELKVQFQQLKSHLGDICLTEERLKIDKQNIFSQMSELEKKYLGIEALENKEIADKKKEEESKEKKKEDLEKSVEETPKKNK